MKLYDSPYSSNARKVRMAAALLGLELERVNVDLATGAQRAPDFLALNANGKVPVLVDGDFVLSESHAIAAYLADRTPGQKLYPTDLRERADVNKWMFWSANHWGPAISILNWERNVKKIIGRGEADPALIAYGEGLFHTFAKVLDEHLAKRDWLSGKRISLADVSVACPAMVAEPAALPLASYANVERWFARVRELDAWNA